MARGWESKSVESQIEDRDQPPPPSSNTHTDAALERELNLLLLAQKRLEYEIAMASSKGFRAIKQRALAHIEEQIRSMSSGH